MKDWRVLGVMKRFGLRGLKDKATEAALCVAQFWSDAAYVAKPQLASPAIVWVSRVAAVGGCQMLVLLSSDKSVTSLRM